MKKKIIDANFITSERVLDILVSRGVKECVDSAMSSNIFNYDDDQLDAIVKKHYSAINSCSYLYVAFSLFYLDVIDHQGNSRIVFKIGLTKNPYVRFKEGSHLPNRAFFLCVFVVPRNKLELLEQVILNIGDYLNLSYKNSGTKLREFLYIEMLKDIPKILEELVDYGVVGFSSFDKVEKFQTILTWKEFDGPNKKSVLPKYFYDSFGKVLSKCFGRSLDDISAGTIRYSREDIDPDIFSEEYLLENIKKVNEDGILLECFLEFYDIYTLNKSKMICGSSILELAYRRPGLSRGPKDFSTHFLSFSLKDSNKVLASSKFFTTRNGEFYILISNRVSSATLLYSLKSTLCVSRVLNRSVEAPLYVKQLFRREEASILDFKLAICFLYFLRVPIRACCTQNKSGGSLTLDIEDFLDSYPLIPKLDSDEAKQSLLDKILPLYKKCILFEFGDEIDF